MAIMAMAATVPKVMTTSLNLKSSVNSSKISDVVAVCSVSTSPFPRLTSSCVREFRHRNWPICAVSSGLEASITDQSKNDIKLDDVKIVVESQDDDKIDVRVDLTGEQTQKAFDDILINLARTVLQFQGSGELKEVPKSFLLQILGKDRVTKFLIQEIVSTTIRDYVNKENLKVKSQLKTIQSAEELEAAFVPGGEFGFNATIEFDKSENEANDSSSSE